MKYDLPEFDAADASVRNDCPELLRERDPDLITDESGRAQGASQVVEPGAPVSHSAGKTHAAALGPRFLRAALKYSPFVMAGMLAYAAVVFWPSLSHLFEDATAVDVQAVDTTVPEKDPPAVVVELAAQQAIVPEAVPQPLDARITPSAPPVDPPPLAAQKVLIPKQRKESTSTDAEREYFRKLNEHLERELARK